MMLLKLNDNVLRQKLPNRCSIFARNLMAAFAKPLLPARRFISRNLIKNEMDIQELVKKEIEFCNEIDCEKNEHGKFIYESKNGKSSMNLPYVLKEYKQWLIDKRLVKEVQ